MLALLLSCTTTPATDATAGPGDADTDTSSDMSHDTSGDSGSTTNDTADTSTPTEPRAVILFIGDGMGFEHVAGGSLYAFGARGSSAMERLPVHGRVRTASLTGVTDSAAAATALATGAKTFNNRVGIDGDGLAVEHLAERARALGLATGVVTNDTLTGATPAAFLAHVEDRTDSAGILAGVVANLPDVTLGGGAVAFDPFLTTLGAQIVRTAAELAAAVPDGRPLFGVFASATFPYVIEGYTIEPTLANMTATALDFLDDAPDGFFLMVEGARIDHASHQMATDTVHPETAAFDEAVSAAIAWSASTSLETTIVVTADHECGGLTVSGSGTAGIAPDSTWRWTAHTNDDVPVYAQGPLTSVFDGTRLDDTWVHATLAAALDGATTVTAPTIPRLVDGDTADLGTAIVSQSWPTSFGAGFNQLDALHVTTDADGIYVGVDGVFQREDNAVVVLFDLDYGAGTGVGADTTLVDGSGLFDAMLTAADFDADLAGLGFDVAVGSVGAEENGLGVKMDSAGERGLAGEWGASDDLAWLDTITNFDDGNIAEAGAMAPDAGTTGATEGGYEFRVPWSSIFPAGIQPKGVDVAVVAVLVSGDGTWTSNQALPPFASSTEPGAAGASFASVVRFSVNRSGALVDLPAVAP